MPPSLDFLQAGIPPFSLSFGMGSLGSFPQGVAGSSTQSSAASQASQPPPTFSHEYSFLQPHSLLAQQPASSSEAGTSQRVHDHDQDQFYTGSGQTFGLEPLGYNESVSFLPSVIVSEPQAGTGGYAQPDHTLASVAAPVLDPGMPDFALIDDALVAWPDLPPAVG